MPTSPGDDGSPRPPEGDWLGTPFLTFRREGPFAIVHAGPPEGAQRDDPAMYFGIRYAITRVNADADLAGLLITGTGDVFAPGGDLGGGRRRRLDDFGSTLGMDVTPFETLRQSPKPVVSAVNGLCQGGGLQIAMCSDLAVVSERATFRVPELFRGIADTYYSQMLARDRGPGSHQGPDVHRPDADGTGGRRLGHGRAGGSARRAAGRGTRGARPNAAEPHPAAAAVVKASLDNYLGLFDRIGMQASIESAEAVEGFVAFRERRSPSWVHPELRTDGRL